MILSEIAVKRPVFTTMMIAAIIVFGVISFLEIGIDLFPRVEFPIITILSVLPGADPETIEITVTDPIEEAVSTISAIKHLRSISSEGISQVIIEFELEKDIDIAYQEVQAKLGTIRSELPSDLESPVVEKLDIDATPIMAILISGDLPIRDLTYLADKVIKQRLQRIQNVGQVKLIGDQERKMWIWIDRGKLEGHGLAVQDVENALRFRHIEYPGGRVETGLREYVVKTKAEFISAQGFANMVVKYKNNAPVRIKDIGEVEDGLEEERSLARLNGQRAVALLVRRQSGTNTVAVADAVKKEVKKIQQELKGIHLEIAKDQSIFIKHSVHEVHSHIIFGGGLAILIVLIFLRNLSSTFITFTVIPTSVIGSFIMMNALGFTQNTVSLLALTLAIGLLIDDTIVVQENIMRHIEQGKPLKQAAIDATQEVGLAVLAATLSVVAVFVPVAFMKGLIGRFFYQFGLTVAFSVLISMFVAFTLAPMLSAYILRKNKQGIFSRIFEKVFQFIEQLYSKILALSLKLRWLVVLIAVCTFLASGYAAKFIRTEFIPLEDQSEFLIKVKAPLGSSLQYTDNILEEIRKKIQPQPWVDYIFTTIGADALQRVNEGEIYIKMIPKSKRSVSQKDAMEWVRKELEVLQEIKTSVEIVPRISGGGQKWADVQMEIRGKDLQLLQNICKEIIAKMKASKGYTDIDTSFESGKPELNIYIRRDHAADMGVSPLSIASTIKALVGGRDVTKFKVAGDRYDVSIRLKENFRNTPEEIYLLKVKNKDGKLVPLQNVVHIQNKKGPVQINRYNRTREITILANLQRDQKVLGQAVTEMTRFAQQAHLPSGYSFDFVGLAHTMQESFYYLFFALFLAIIMVYMVLASQFESFLHPFTIMLSLPLAIIGTIGALLVTKTTLSIFTMIGIIMLMGLVTKNAILLIEFIRQLREQGLTREQAVLKAGPIRLRPILMTAISTIFGMLPVALGTGAGSESRAPMALAVIGGLTTSTILTLLVVPVVYTLLDDLVVHLRKVKK